ncbi:hypothetical protein GQ54DRAFT_258602 [Martensiomyces pterosporus]|nr:hypothetical protein GQ54DRAFT_258602 [Martensiomyces pterosporus]
MSSETSLPGLLRQRQHALGTRPDNAYSYVYPNRTVYNVETPDCFFRRFTPDGKYLVGFNRSLTGLQVFHVLSASATTQQLAEAGAVPNKGEFRQFFKLAWAQDFAGLGETLHRELCLVTSDMRYMLVVRLRRTDINANMQQQRNHFPNALACVTAVEDMTLLVIDIRTGRVADTRAYPNDIIYLSGHSGFSLFEDQLCIVSLKYQCLRILRIEANGTLVDVQEVGWYTREDDGIYEEALRIREEKAEAERSLTAKRKMMDMRLRGLGSCIDDVKTALGIKRRRIHPAREPRLWLRQGRRASGAAGAYGSEMPSAAGSSHSTEESTGASSASAQPSSSTSHSWSAADSRDSMPFIFPYSSLGEAVMNQAESSSSAASARMPSPGSTETRVSATAETLDLAVAAAAGRASVVHLQALQRLPPHYRLMVTRSMQTAGRLESLADSDISTIELSLTSAPHGGLKQRLLGALFMQARQENDGGLALQNFYRSYRQYEGLVLWRAQFVTASRLLLRFVPIQLAISRSHSPRALAITSSSVTNSFSLLAEYDVREAKFGKIWDTSGQDIYREVESRLDMYRAPMAASSNNNSSDSRVACGGRQAPSISNDLHLRDAFVSTQAAIRTARSGGPVQAARKASVLLPFAPQCMQESPFLDPSRFKCNLRVRQTVEKLRPANMMPIKFYDRRTGAIKFVLSPTPYYCSVLYGGDSSSAPNSIDNAAEDPTAAPGYVHIHGGIVSRSGSVLLPSGGIEEMGMWSEPGGGNGGGSSSSSTATTTQQLQQQAMSAPQYNHRAGVYYLFHPTLPLAISTQNDMNATSLPASNIHFWRGD